MLFEGPEQLKLHEHSLLLRNNQMLYSLLHENLHCIFVFFSITNLYNALLINRTVLCFLWSMMNRPTLALKTVSGSGKEGTLPVMGGPAPYGDRKLVPLSPPPSRERCTSPHLPITSQFHISIPNPIPIPGHAYTSRAPHSSISLE